MTVHTPEQIKEIEDHKTRIRDATDDTSTDLHADGTTDTVISVAASPAFTFVTATDYDFMIAVNENRECYYWIDSVFEGVVRRGPENDLTTMGIWAFVQNNTSGNDKTIELDYVLAWQERVRLPRSV